MKPVYTSSSVCFVKLKPVPTKNDTFIYDKEIVDLLNRDGILNF